jgi:hypothetical protein
MIARRSVMTRWLQAAALGVAATLAVPAAASAQSLADVATKEKERRSGKKVKSYSEDDLRRAGGSMQSFETTSDDSSATAEGAAPAEGTASADASAPEGAPPKEKSDDEQRAAAQKAWRDKVQKAQADLNATAAEIEGIQKSLADNTANYYSAARTEMLTRLDGLTKRYATQKDALESARDEGRRNRYQE